MWSTPALHSRRQSEKGSRASVTASRRPVLPHIPPDREYHTSDPVTPPIRGGATAIAGGVDLMRCTREGDDRQELLHTG